MILRLNLKHYQQYFIKNTSDLCVNFVEALYQSKRQHKVNNKSHKNAK